ncbi:MAG: META domain-containing protein [bacterium]|nr:META domain-containing protein [bacterium]
MKTIFPVLAVLLLAQGLSACQSLPPAEPSVLPDTVWQASELNGQALVLLEGEWRPQLQFGRDGHVSGRAGCNLLRGDYQHSGRELRIAPLVSTQRLCPAAIMKREKEFLRALEGGSSYVRDADTLGLRNPIGITLVRFQSAGLSGQTKEPATFVPAGSSGSPRPD